MIEMGLVVAFGFIATFMKLSWKWRMRMLSRPLLMDVICFVLLTTIHWGTFTGVMVAAVGALFLSITITAARKLFGYMEHGKYVPGRFNIENKL